jgi:pimeloyl-ACP methyl ester carboxylesterase
MEPQVRYARTSDGVSVAHATAGNGPPVLVVPFVPVSHVGLIWRLGGLESALARWCAVTSYDSRGSGLSDRSRTDYSLDALLRDASAVLDAVGLERSAVVSEWDGVPVALALAARWPERIERVIVINGWASPSDINAPVRAAALALRKQDWAIFVQTAARVLSGVDDDALARAFVEYWHASVDPDAYWRSRTSSTAGISPARSDP